MADQQQLLPLIAVATSTQTQRTTMSGIRSTTRVKHTRKATGVKMRASR